MSEVAATVPVQLASPVASETRNFPTPGAPPVIFTCPATSSLAHGAAVPIPRLPVFKRRIVSILFVLNTRSCRSVVPMKLVPAIVPEFPMRDHTPETAERDTQLASHVASEERTLLIHGDPPVIFTCPATSSFAQGVNVPIPTLVESS